LKSAKTDKDLKLILGGMSEEEWVKARAKRLGGK